MKKFDSVQHYMDSLEVWQSEVALLRGTLRSTELEETLKWSQPCYTWAGKNVVGLAAFKSYFGLWFYDGAEMPDKKQVLMNAQKGKTQAMRQWRMTSGKEIKPSIVKQYVKDAIQVVQAGKTLKPRHGKPVVVPPELQAALQQKPTLAKRFEALSLSCRREYAEYIAEAKRAETKLRRIEKILPMIQDAVALHDKYR